MTAGASDTHNSNSSLDNSATDRYGMASVSSSNQYEIPHELQEVLLDFTVQYLIERPDDLTEFAFHYFSRLKRKKNQEIDHQSDESMVSEDEQGIFLETCCSARNMRWHARQISSQPKI